MTNEMEILQGRLTHWRWCFYRSTALTSKLNYVTDNLPESDSSGSGKQRYCTATGSLITQRENPSSADPQFSVFFFPLTLNHFTHFFLLILLLIRWKFSAKFSAPSHVPFACWCVETENTGTSTEDSSDEEEDEDEEEAEDSGERPKLSCANMSLEE